MGGGELLDMGQAGPESQVAGTGVSCGGRSVHLIRPSAFSLPECPGVIGDSLGGHWAVWRFHLGREPLGWAVSIYTAGHAGWLL